MTPLRKILAVLGAVLVLCLLVIGTTVVVKALDRPPACAPGVTEIGPLHECIGVTTGTYPFTAALASTERKIANEDSRVAGHEHVSIALLMPFTTTGDPTVAAELLHALDGAYAAQYQANHQSQNEQPAIELLLGNDGTGNAEWLPVVKQLAGMTDAPYQLRAVTGISTSEATTKAAVTWLSQRQIPVVGDAITANDIANSRGSDPFPTLARIAPTNTDEAAALTHFSAIDPRTTVLIEDRHADDYISSLATAFAAVLRGSPYQPMEYTSPSSYTEEGDSSGQFMLQVQTLCETNARLILFAGRHVQLRQLVNELAQRGCVRRSFTILTGDDASHLTQDPLLDRGALSDGITVDYAALAYPGTAIAMPGPDPGSWQKAYRDFLTAMSSAGLPAGRDDLSDGQAIMAHDAVWTAVMAIRNYLAANGSVPTGQQVTDTWSQLYGAHTVLGASGWICLDNQGNPYDRPVPVEALTASGSPDPGKIAWPTGRPPAWPCEPPP